MPRKCLGKDVWEEDLRKNRVGSGLGERNLGSRSQPKRLTQQAGVAHGSLLRARAQALPSVHGLAQARFQPCTLSSMQVLTRRPLPRLVPTQAYSRPMLAPARGRLRPPLPSKPRLHPAVGAGQPRSFMEHPQ